MPRVLILCPTFDHADALYFSINSVRNQTVSDWQMIVIGDGAPERTRKIVEAIAAVDQRIAYLAFPKAERYGEEHRDVVIRESQAKYICHLSDDDIWMPDHLANLTRLLTHGDWVAQAPIRIMPNGNTRWMPINMGTPAMRRSATAVIGPGVGINYVAYRRDAYLRLSHGWAAAPRELGPSDRYNWSNFFHDPSISIATQAVTSALKFPSQTVAREHLLPESRAAELGPWLARSSEPGLARRMSQSGSVYQRYIRLFLLHGAWDCPDVDASLALCGMAAVAPDAESLPAREGDILAVPLTEAQRSEVTAAFHVVRRFATIATAPSIEDELVSIVGRSKVYWLEAIFGLGLTDPNRALAYMDKLSGLDDMAQSWCIRLSLHQAQGKTDQAYATLEQAARRWPNAAWIRRFQDRLDAASQ